MADATRFRNGTAEIASGAGWHVTPMGEIDKSHELMSQSKSCTQPRTTSTSCFATAPVTNTYTSRN